MLFAILLAGIVFYETFVALRTLEQVREMMKTTRESFAVVQSPSLSDEEKASAMQRGSLKMFGGVFLSTAKLALAIAATALFLYAVSFIRWSFEDLVAYSIRPVPLIATVLFLIVYGKIRHGRRA